jgi:beta-glucosidase
MTKAITPFDLGEDCLLGVATAPRQIEGGDPDCTWARWCRTGDHIKDGSTCERANDHWNRVDEDVALLKELGCRTYRLGVSWSRIEPRPGMIDEKAVEHYRRELKLLIDAGIRPFVTLHHFAHPLWFEDTGGWEAPQSVRLFVSFTRAVVERLGDLVADWCTINEPAVFAVAGYVAGLCPPGKKDVVAYFKVLRNLCLAHREAYAEIHRVRGVAGYRDTMVGVAHHLRVFDGEKGPLDRAIARFFQFSFQDLTLEAMTLGLMRPPIGTDLGRAGAHRVADFVGINYYSHDIVRFDPRRPAEMFAERRTDPALDKSDLGWDIYPEGLYRLCRQAWERYGLPIWITENGICDRTDAKRPEFVAAHLAEVARLRSEGVPLDRFYYWTLMDNFEWLEGETAPFGLVACDFATQRREIRPSGRMFAEISRARGLSAGTIERYLSPR